MPSKEWKTAHYALLKLWTKYTVPHGTPVDSTPRIEELYDKQEWNDLQKAIDALEDKGG